MQNTKQFGPDTWRFKLLAVVVLYKMKPSESATLSTLKAAILQMPPERADIQVLVYDNTPGGQDLSSLPEGIAYKADINNGGLPKAYNYALEVAYGAGLEWLLTLDQDTTLPTDFIYKLSVTAKSLESMSDVVAIAPFISGDGLVISPSIPSRHWAEWKHLPNGFIGISRAKPTIVVNSATTVRVSTLKDIGGYNPKYWLDFCDVELFYRFHLYNLRVFVAGNIQVQHEVSVSDLMKRTTAARYENILRAEEAFYDERLGRIEGLMLLLRITYRFYKLQRGRLAFSYFVIAAKFFLRRLCYTRNYRIRTQRLSVTHHAAL